MNIENDAVFWSFWIGCWAGVTALISVGACYNLPPFPHALTLPAWLVGWYLVCCGVDGILSVTTHTNP